MSQSRNKIGWKLIILLIVSAAFVLTRFGIVSADEVETKEESVVMAQADNAKDKTVPTSTRLSGMTTKDEESLV
ncbi:MAG: hypothetical protein GY845_18500, partial [Planctomycetes bacterium]|nr:hypothetical protein [Planctomycetota bacterium]